jgi:phenylpropionate dioxygenase-like ring-hydroxylating dioxygenase large terminal subunit
MLIKMLPCPCPLTKKPLEETTMFIRNAWYIAAWADEIGETPLARRICNEPVVLYRDQQNCVAALHDM